MSVRKRSRLVVAGLLLALTAIGPGTTAATVSVSAGLPQRVVDVQPVLPPSGGITINARLMDPDAPGLG